MREYENIHSESYKTAKYTNIDKGFAGDIDKQFLDLSNKFPIDTKDIDVKALSKDGIFGCYSGGLSYVDKKTGTIGVTQQITLSNKNMPNKEIAERKHITEATRRGSKNISGLSTVDHEYAHAIDLQYAYKTDKTLHDRMLKYNNFKLTGTSQERNSVIRDINDINAQLHSSSRDMNWQSIVISIVSLVLTALFTWATERLIAWLNEKLKGSKSATHLLAATNIVLNVVRATYQTYVQSLKDGNAFDEEKQRIAFDKAKAAAVSQMSTDVQTYIQSTYGSVDAWLTNAIEAAIYDLKNKNKKSGE